MFRLWGKLWKDNRLLKDETYEDSSEETRTHKVFAGVEHFCYDFDLGKPIWLDRCVNEFKKHGRARFYQDSFIEEIPFDFMEIEVIEED